MKTKIFFLLVVLFFINYKAQIIKDILFGNPKYVKESVVFLTEKQNWVFMEGDSDYGHAVGVDPPNLRKLFSNRWFNGSICGFISNETYYNKDKSINEEFWYLKSGKLMSYHQYRYDNIGRQIFHKVKFGHDFELAADYFFFGDSKDSKFVNVLEKDKSNKSKYDTKYIDNTPKKIIYEYDTLKQEEKIYELNNERWYPLLENGNSTYQQRKDSVFYKYLTGVNLYNKEHRLLNKKTFSTDLNNKPKLTEEISFEYDELGRKVKEINHIRNGYSVYKYLDDTNIVREGSSFYDGKLSYSYKYTFKNNYIASLWYFNAYIGGSDESFVIFKYKFDKKGNWTEIIKNVDGKDLYKWIREIKYY